MFSRTDVQLSMIAASLCLSAVVGCAAPGAYSKNGARQSPERDFCPDRLPVAQKRIQEAYEGSGRTSAGGSEEFSATVEGPAGERISVSVSSSVTGMTEEREIGPSDVQTGLADLVFNCGKQHFSDKDCFVDVYLDGEKLTSMGPNTSGRVPLKCVPAGRHELRIDSVASTIYKGTINLESDVEHLARVEETESGGHNFEIYARNRLPGRIPQPKRRAEGDGRDGQGANVEVEVDDEQARHHHDSGGDDRAEQRRRDDDNGRAMSDAEFADLTTKVKEESFKDAKVRVVKVASKDNLFTARQVEVLVGLQEYSDERVKVAKMLYDRTVDQNNYYKVLSAFEYDSSKEELKETLDL